jgi:hypothetical protein
MGMDIKYLKEFMLVDVMPFPIMSVPDLMTYVIWFSGPMTATTTIDKETFFKLAKYPGQVHVPVIVTDTTGETTADAKVTLSVPVSVADVMTFVLVRYDCGFQRSPSAKKESNRIRSW